MDDESHSVTLMPPLFNFSTGFLGAGLNFTANSPVLAEDDISGHDPINNIGI